MRRTAMRRTPLEDDGEEPIDEAVVAPDQVQDIAMRRTGLAVRATSIQRDTADEAASVDVGAEEAGETFVAQVVGYNGSSDPDPYVIRRSDAPQAVPPACPSRNLSNSLSIPYPDIPSSAKALYLVDPGRMAARDGAASTQSMLAKLQQLANATDGVVVPVEGNPRVSTTAAFSAWDANPCSVEAANAVVTAINEVVDDARSRANGLPALRSIVLIGPDDVIPQGRIADRTVVGHEADYADDATVDRNGDGVPDDSAVSAAMRQGFLLSDDPYGDFDPAENIYSPDVALGRLVETPAQVEAQASAFLSSGGVLSPQRSFVAGYDFLSDGAAEIQSSLSSAVPAGSSPSRIDENWTASDALAAFNAPGAGFLSVNGHYDHYRALPAAAFNGTNPDLLSASQTSVPAGSLVFTVGCHAGLNLAVGDASSPSNPLLGDWAERMTSRGALYAANTGFGYGDDTAVAYSELVMAKYASGLVSRTSTAGQALMFAKQQAIGTVGVPDVYWTKAAEEATFYGLPMYRIAGSVEAPSVVPPIPDPQDPPADPTTRTSNPEPFDLTTSLHSVSDDRGTHWEAGDSDPLVVNGRPIQPKLTRDVTSADGPAHGYLLESLTTTDLAPADPAIASATIDDSDHEPEPEATDPFFPATPATVESVATPTGRRDILTVMGGAYRGDHQRLNLSHGRPRPSLELQRLLTTDHSPRRRAGFQRKLLDPRRR